MGAPTIRAYYDGECYQAIEGSHRLAAAYSLGLVPHIVEITIDDIVEHDMDDVRGNTVNDILTYLEMSGPHYDFD